MRGYTFHRTNENDDAQKLIFSSVVAIKRNKDEDRM